MIALIHGYRFVISPWLGSACRYHPSCSQYAVTVIERDGALRGGAKALARLARCNPMGRGGLDLP